MPYTLSLYNELERRVIRDSVNKISKLAAFEVFIFHDCERYILSNEVHGDTSPFNFCQKMVR